MMKLTKSVRPSISQLPAGLVSREEAGHPCAGVVREGSSASKFWALNGHLKCCSGTKSKARRGLIDAWSGQYPDDLRV